MKRNFFLVLAVWLIAFSGWSQEPAKTSIAIYPIKPAGAEASLAQALTSLLSTQLTPSPKLRVIEEAMLKAVMERQGMNVSDACDDTVCQVEIGKLIQAQKIITGDIAKLGGKYLLSLKLIDIQTGALEFTTQDKCACPEDELDALVAVAGAKVRNHFGENVPVPDLPVGQAFLPVVQGAQAPAPAQPGRAAVAAVPVQKIIAPPEAVEAFFKAVEGGNLQDTQMLLSMYMGLVNAKNRGEQFYVPGTIILGYREKDWSPLHFAAQNGHKAVCELLLANGADINAKSPKDSDMHIHKFAVQLSKPFGNLTPLHLAAKEGQREVVELLIAKGAEVNARDGLQNTPLDYASEGKHKDVADLLSQHGGTK